MIDKSLLRQVVPSQKQIIICSQPSIKRKLLRDVLQWFADPQVLILTGVRRCGKSTLLRQLMEQKTNWCYVTFEDERLLSFEAKDFELLNEVLIELYGQINTYFFDEVQNVEKFETFVRRLQDEGKKVIITGSNASLLSKEFGTRLTGRYKTFEVYPFSFQEFLLFKGIVVTKNDVLLTEKRVLLATLFTEYLAVGGFPEYLKNQDKEYVRTVMENILYKDIIVRYSIRSERAIQELVGLLSSSIAAPFTYNSLKNSLGLANAITVKEYISYLQNAYVFFELRKYFPSLRKQLDAPRKIYLIDVALQEVLGARFSPNAGRILENTVFVNLKRQGKEVYYFADKGECDFVIKEKAKITTAIQVCYVLDESNRKREVAGLLEVMQEFNLDKGFILTFEQSEEITIDGKTIFVLPVYQWMLE